MFLRNVASHTEHTVLYPWRLQHLFPLWEPGILHKTFQTSSLIRGTHICALRPLQGVSKRALQFWKLISIYSEDMYSVLNCHTVAEHTEFYLGQLRFNVTSTGNAKCFKKRFTTLKAYTYLFRGHVQCFELSYCSRTHRYLGQLRFNVTSTGNARCFKKRFTTLKAYTYLFRDVQFIERPWCSKTHRVLPGIVTVQCDFHW
jgi:ribosomal protein L31